ncbi:MAG: chemotaxis protein CheX [Demequina sp.]
MSAPATSLAMIDADAVTCIATDLFTTMIDGEPGHLTPWWTQVPAVVEPRFTWIDIQGRVVTRVLLTAGRETGERLTRALLALPDDVGVDDADFADAVGELANVVGGNVKSLVTDSGALTLPVVAHTRPATDGASAIVDVWLNWRGAPLSVSLWALPRRASTDLETEVGEDI